MEKTQELLDLWCLNVKFPHPSPWSVPPPQPLMPTWLPPAFPSSLSPLTCSGPFIFFLVLALKWYLL
jgi:hypothetical protein